MKNKKMIASACLLLLAAQPAIGADAPIGHSMQSHASRPGSPESSLEEAVQVVGQMKKDARMRNLLGKAKAVFIMPAHSGQQLATGDQNVPGILLVRSGSGWSNPVFYHVGPIVLGAHAGAGVDALATLLLKDAAVKPFLQGKRFTLSRDGGFNMSDHSAHPASMPDEGDDAIMWSNAAGIFPGPAVRLEDILPDDRVNQRFYGGIVTPREIVAGEVGSFAQAEKLRQALKK